jgi:hypothetical protein
MELEQYCDKIPQLSDRLWGLPSPLSNEYRGDLSTGVKLPEREADHSSPLSAEVKKACSSTSAPTGVHDMLLNKAQDVLGRGIYLSTGQIYLCLLPGERNADIQGSDTLGVTFTKGYISSNGLFSTKHAVC